MPRHDPRAIANSFLLMARERNVQLTKMSLIKLVFLAHGWSLAFFDEPIVEATPQAWKFGPVYPSLYTSLSAYTSQPVDKIITDDIIQVPYTADNLSASETRLLDSVFSSYAKMGAFALSDLTHLPGSPWHTVYNTQGAYKPIPDDLLRAYYTDIRERKALPRNALV